MSEAISTKRGLVFGTAGHIDHGKTMLVRALTGVDTDRLAEEKKRGISIELGFAQLSLPNKQRVSIIDVPGHDKFIKNMLAGAAGIDAVLLVVAADEGVKPQTKEHFDICRMLGVSDGLLVLSKADAASDSRIQEVKEQVCELVAGSFLQNAACVAVSAQKAAGIPVLLDELTALASRLTPRPTSSYARLPVDRSFTMQGFGTVVTGTLSGGTIKAGDMLEIHPLREQYRVRGLQVHGNSVSEARAGQRTAVNLAGVDAKRIHRGAVLTLPGIFESTEIFDAEVDWLDPKFATRLRQPLHLFVGCAEGAVDVRLIETVHSQRTLTRLSSREPLLLLPGDRFVLRNSVSTVGGGVVIDCAPPIRLNKAKTKVRLARLASGGDSERIRILVEENTQGRKISNLVKLTGWTPERVRELAKVNPSLYIFEAEQRILSTVWIEQKREQLVSWLKAFHAANPSAKGAAMHQLRSAMMSGIESSIVDFVLKTTPNVEVVGETISMKEHSVRLSPAELAAREKLELVYRSAGFEPPSLSEALKASGLDGSRGRGQLEALIKGKKLVKVSADLIFHPDALEHIKRSISAHKGRRFTVPEFKEWTNVSRKYAIPLLEFLDREHVTRREGDTRVVL